MRPPADDYCKCLFENHTAEEIATADGLSKEQFLDKLLLCMFDALSLKQSEEWSNKGGVNIPADETPELAKWFMKGQAVGSKPIFDGICSQCGTLLHGAVGQHSALSNKVVGVPIDRDGNPALDPDGLADTHAQPPFLLRYSPSLFAKEAPALFKHDA